MTTPVYADEYITPPVVEPIVIDIRPTEGIKRETALRAGIECNCYAYQKAKYFPSLPSSSEIRANLTQNIGDVAVFYYPESGLYHYAKVLSTDGYAFVIDEANYHRCKISQRTLTLDYPRLLGFWSSNS